MTKHQTECINLINTLINNGIDFKRLENNSFVINGFIVEAHNEKFTVINPYGNTQKSYKKASTVITKVLD